MPTGNTSGEMSGCRRVVAIDDRLHGSCWIQSSYKLVHRNRARHLEIRTVGELVILNEHIGK